MYFATFNVAGFEPSLHGMRYPMQSWDRSDSDTFCRDFDTYKIGEADMTLATSLIKAGGEHRKFLRMINVWFEADMPRYFWQEFDTYHFNTKNSESTMHKLLNSNKEIKLDYFVYCKEDLDLLTVIISRLEKMRKEYEETKSTETKERLLLRAKRLLPEGFLQMRMVCTNYEELRTIYHQRKHHRLKEEWIETFCVWVETLPYAKEFITTPY